MSKPSSALDASSCDVYADSARHPLTRTWCVAALALICCALWGSAIPCIKIGYELLGIQNGDVPSEFLFAGVRFMLAGAIALAAAVITRRRLPRVSRTGWPLVIRLSLAQTIVQYAFFYIGVSNASGVRGSIVNAMNTFLCVLMAALVFRQERLTARKVLGCAIGFAGVAIVNLTGGDSGGAVTLTGEGFILIAAVSYAVSSALIHTYSQREDPVALSGYQFISPSHRAKPLRQHAVQPSHRRPGREGLSFLLSDSACSRSERVKSRPLPPRPARSHYTVYCGRSCRAMTSMPMSLALPWPCWSSRTASMALTYVLAADIAVTQVTPRRTASVRSR
ncbi:EamA family transporter [Collinsella aerofaciens]|uniref:EamA family transporter n=1 Tax=Collinsella aerofaciens TaxID=74426 RepID=A0A6L8RK95_9ACTN|nr:EamA family transporter [Collinsella aerofaciens]MZJ86184.1 EamA family transporter [Collinsella aerofaciens]